MGYDDVGGRLSEPSSCVIQVDIASIAIEKWLPIWLIALITSTIVRASPNYIVGTVTVSDTTRFSEDMAAMN